MGLPFAGLGLFNGVPRSKVGLRGRRPHLTHLPELRKRDGAGDTSPRRGGRRSVRLMVLAAAGAATVFTRVEIVGDSMLPTLEQGDRLVVLRFGHRRRLRLGDLVTVRDPRGDGHRRVLVKRVADVDRESVELT